MKKHLFVKRFGCACLTAAMALGLLAGCGSSSSDSADASSGSTASETSAADSGSGEKIKVKVGISADNMPYSYMDENEEYTGFEYELIMACAEKLEDKYEFEVIMDEWTNLLVGIDTGTYDFAAGSFGYTEERAANYLYQSKPTVVDDGFHIGYKAGRMDITDLKSLAGKTVATTQGILAEQIVLDWNEANPDYEILLEYPGGYETIYAGIENGLYDAFIASTIEMSAFNRKFDNFMDVTEDTIDYDIGTLGIYYIFAKDQTGLQEDFDACIEEMREDGSLGELSKKWFDADLTDVSE